MMTFLKWLWRSDWLLPIILLLVLTVLTVAQISGSSIDIVAQTIYGPTSNHNLIEGMPRAIRSDEWLVNTQDTVAQSAAGWPMINPNIADGQDMSVILDVPYKNWSEVFHPQNWAFFIMPLANAFAFKWWGMLFALIIIAYFLCLELLPKRRLVSALVALSLGLSPYVFWWFQAITIASLGESMLIGLIVLKFVRATNRWWQYVLSIILGWLAVCFVLILYPPFMIPCAIAVAALVTGILLERRDQFTRERLKQLVPQLILTIAIITSVIGIFYSQHYTVIQTINSTVYPGQRNIGSGHFSPVSLLSHFLDYKIQTQDGNYAPVNQSEAAGFILLLPYLLIPSLWLTWKRWRLHRELDWAMLAVNAAVLLFLARLFLPWPNLPYRLLLLNKVQGTRLLIGLGLLNFFQLILLYRSLHRGPSRTRLLAGVTSGTSLAVMAIVGRKLRHEYPSFLPHHLPIVILAVVTAACIGLILMQRTNVLGLAIYLGLNIASVASIIPLYHGLGSLVNSSLLSAIVGTPRSSTFVTNQSIELENYPALGNRRIYSGTQSYPQLALWRSVDNTTDAQNIYNRYAHVFFNVRTGPTQFLLTGGDNFTLNIDPCSTFMQVHVNYVLSLRPIESDCLGPAPKNIGKTWLYQIRPPS